ncbi:transglutaminase domain-containing protein [Salinimicrobium soli]|uniref:transglutaminase domain-containing protein n=1 Tax=Salinimicrobium soli TaxID=1254399 RepID=UPI003AAD49C7
MTKIIYSAFFLFVFIAGVQAQDYKFGKVSKEEVLEESHPLDKDADAAILYREQKTWYEYRENSGFILFTDVHERIKIYNKDGFSYATKEISLYRDGGDRERVSNLKAYTYNIKNGKLEKDKLSDNGIFEEEVNENFEKTKLTMPAVTEGSVIEYRYRIQSPFFYNIDVVPLQYMIPVNRLETMIRIPEYLMFKIHVNLKSPLQFPIDQSKGHGRITIGTSNIEFTENQYEVKADNIPALKKEEYVDYLQNYLAYLKWELQYTKFPNSLVKSWTSTWEDVTKNIYDHGFSRELNRSFYDDELEELLSGVTSPEEKVNLIYNFVKEKIKWNGRTGYMANDGGRRAWKDGEGNTGDINLLLTGMLKSAGLKAYPVLASTRDHGIPLFPTREGFNYVISSVQMPNDQWILLDATEKTSAPGELPWRVRNWQGRIVQENGASSWINLMPKNASEDQTMLNYTLDENLVLKGKSIHNLNGLFAKSYRDKYAAVNDESYLEELGKKLGNVTINGLEKHNVEEVGKDIREIYEFEMEQAVDHINGKIYLKPLLFQALDENPFKEDERKYPVFFDFPMVKNNTVNIMIPQGYQVESLPESIIVEMNEGAGNFKFLVKQNGNFLRIDSILELNTTVFSPQHYEYLKSFYSQILEKQSENIVLSAI